MNVPEPEVWWISTPALTFTITARGGIVTSAAPVAKWAVGKPLSEVLAYYRLRPGSRVENITHRKQG